MKEDYLKILAIVVSALIIVYLVLNMFHIQPLKEGLENATTASDAIPDITSNMTGVAGGAANYAANIKAKTVQLQDTILISKYRTDYENIIMNLEDYFSMLMLQQILSINPSDSVKTNMERIAGINSLSTGKNSLNDIMTYIDKQ
jgi:hypothetical protein